MIRMVNGVVGAVEVHLREFHCKERGGGGRLRHAT